MPELTGVLVGTYTVFRPGDTIVCGYYRLPAGELAIRIAGSQGHPEAPDILRSLMRANLRRAGHDPDAYIYDVREASGDLCIRTTPPVSADVRLRP